MASVARPTSAPNKRDKKEKKKEEKKTSLSLEVSTRASGSSEKNDGQNRCCLLRWRILLKWMVCGYMSLELPLMFIDGRIPPGVSTE